MEYAVGGLVLALVVSLATILMLWRRPIAPPPPPTPPDPVAQLRQEIEAGRRRVAELQLARQSLQGALRGPAAEPGYLAAAAELLATRLSIALEACQVDDLVLRVVERLRETEEEMRARPQLPPPA